MDLQNILKKCGYNNNINRKTYDQMIISNVSYLDPTDDDFCTDIQTLFNTEIANKDNISYGSSYQYNIPPYLDNEQDESNIKRGKSREHFHHTKPIYIYRQPPYGLHNSFFFDYALIIIFFMIVICASVILINRRCYPL